MKTMMILGGLLGFLIGMVFALLQESDWPEVLWRASIAAYLAGLLMRWWGKVWLNTLKQLHLQRLTEAGQAKAQPAPAKN
jgi:hypothetical protein